MIHLHFEDYSEYTNELMLCGYDDESKDVTIDLSISLDNVFQYSVLEDPTEEQRDNIDRYIEMRVKQLFGDKVVIDDLDNPYTEE